ncbi:hypothetical protein NQ318_001383 [Aromia moschata]|uniref:Cilia- and flagella-associated protein 69 ARM repeats domain-containing protein n=1 Tax=Aromia moschata TaxID=1265417 RepID=A0AAV8YXQ7_9CUCU|nr:hypothetical protein NQ318_001383 [Aromia moschata]
MENLKGCSSTGLIRSIISDSDSVRQRCLGLAFFALYKQSIEKSNAVIDITIEYMKQILHPELKQAAHDNRVIICVMDFVWEHIARSEKRSAEFVKKNGVFHMLDIIYKFSFPVQLVTLGALVDICEFGQCLPYIITWRQQGQKNITFLFREENKRLNVKSGPRGEIADVKYPLMGKEQWIQTFCRCIDVNGSPAMADLFISCRPKIYALLQMLNERYKEVVDLADEHYKCYGGELQAEDQVTMLLAENFLALKLGEAWLELKTDLDRIPVTLIPADSKMMTYLIDRAVKWSSYLQKFQKRHFTTRLRKK